MKKRILTSSKHIVPWEGDGAPGVKTSMGAECNLAGVLVSPRIRWRNERNEDGYEKRGDGTL
eukprot:scaffold29115_cov56-Attheya_sp.AAC.1